MPLSLGEKVTEIVQVPWAAIAAPAHVVVSLQSFGAEPPSATPDTWRAALPELVSVITCGVLEVPCVWLPKPRLLEDNETCGCVVLLVPTPEMDTDCGLPGALSVICSIA